MRSKEKNNRTNFLFALAFAGFGAAIEEEEKISGLAYNINRGAWLRLEETLHLLKLLCSMLFFFLSSSTHRLGFLIQRGRGSGRARRRERGFFLNIN